MEPVLTPEEMAHADRAAIEAGTPEAALVLRAGRAVAWAARRVLGGTYGRRVVVVAGKGNNGADGRVAASVLERWGARVDTYELAAGIAPDVFVRAIRRSDLVVDAMFGTGLRGELTGDALTVAQVVADEQSRRPSVRVLAVDIPSGVDGSTGAVPGAAVRADSTVTFGARKPGLLFAPGSTYAGTVEVADIGIDVAGVSRTVTLDESDLVIPRRDAAAHKWSSGLMVVAGSEGMTGAALLVARAAARAGAGMVVCGLPGRDAATRAAGSEVVTRALPATPEGGLDVDAARLVLSDLHRFRALAIGPGLGRDDRTASAVARLVAEAPCPVVVDADGLRALAIDPAPLRVRHAAGLPPAVLTPHAGEYERLADEPVGDDRIDAARRLAHRLDAVVLLKGPGTVIGDPDGRVVVNTTDGPQLATAGTGDVLTGIIGALLAQGVEPAAAAAIAAYVHGRAARVAGTAPGLVAGDLIDALPRTLAALPNRP